MTCLRIVPSSQEFTPPPHLIKILCDFHEIKEGSITFGVDGDSALQQAFSLFLPNIDDPCFGLIAAIHQVRKECPIEWKAIHIKGHQDDHLDFDKLDIWGQLNVEADPLAKCTIPLTKASPCHCIIPKEPRSLWYGSRKISNIEEELYNIIHSEEGRAHWANKDKFPNESIDFIHWGAIGRGIKGLPRLRRNFVAKYCVGMMGVEKFMKQWKQSSHNQCPRCGAQETTHHVVACPAPEAREVWLKAVKNLRSWMELARTDPMIIELVCRVLESFPPHNQTSQFQDRSINLAMLQWSDIGLHLLTEGWVAIEWEEA